MAVIGTFSQFTTARLAIYASQASLSVTGNNISNINTPGYSRQRMDLVSLYSTGQGKYANIFNTNVGYGVLTNGASQLRDIYLDIRYRNENTKLAANNEKLDGLYQIGNILDEVGKGTGQLEGFGVIEAQFGEFLRMLDKGVLTQYGAEEYDDLVRSAASTLTSYFRKAAADLQDIKVNKVNELTESISQINKLLTQIRDLNVQIRTQGIYGDKALELRDARNLAIDQLSSYIPIDVTYSMERIDQFTEVEKLTITIKNSQGPDGQPIKLVDGIYGGQLTMPPNIPEVNDGYNYEKFIEALNKELAARSVWTDSDNGPFDFADISHQLWSDYDPDKFGESLDDLQARVKQAMEQAAQKVQDAADPPGSATAEEVAAAQKKAAEKILNPILQAEAMAAVEKDQGKYILRDPNDGTIIGYTNDYDEAAANSGYFNYNEYEPLDDRSLYMLRVEQLVDQRGRVMDDPNDPSGKSQAIALEETAFCTKSVDLSADTTRVDSNALGSLQAIREMLTRRGEYSSAEDIARDVYATNKRGIRYYELALDSLARKFAEIFNEANQIGLETVYGFTDPSGPITDAEGNPLIYTAANGTKIPLTWDMVMEEVLDADGNPIPATDEDGNPIYLTDASGNPIQATDEDGNPSILRDEDGNPIYDDEGNEIPVYVPLNQYQFKSSVDPKDPNYNPPPETTAELKAMVEQVRKEAAKAPGYSYYQGGVLISNRGDNNDPSNIRAANISISYSWSNHSVRLLNTRKKFDVDGAGNETEHSTIRDNIAHMITLFDTKWDYYADEVYPKVDTATNQLPVFHGSFREVFTAIGSTLAEDYNATAGKVENYSISTLNLDNDRLSVMGVDLNEEATSMMQFSKSYSAACRLLTTIDSMLDTLINGTAR